MREPCADQLAAAVALDMAQWWQPTVAGYLGRVSKTLICEAVTEAKGKAAADNIATLKKGDMATAPPNCSPAPAGFPPCCGPPSARQRRHRKRKGLALGVNQPPAPISLTVIAFPGCTVRR